MSGDQPDDGPADVGDEPSPFDLVLALVGGAALLEQRLDVSLGAWHGTSVTDVRLLRALVDGPRSRAELAAELALSVTDLAKRVGPLERQGYVTVGAAADPRQRRVELTDHGRQLVVDAQTVIAEVADLLDRRARLSVEDRAAMIAIIDDLIPTGSLAKGPRVHRPHRQ